MSIYATSLNVIVFDHSKLGREASPQQAPLPEPTPSPLPGLTGDLEDTLMASDSQVERSLGSTPSAPVSSPTSPVPSSASTQSDEVTGSNLSDFHFLGLVNT